MFSTEEKIDIMRAAIAGKRIECFRRDKFNAVWMEIDKPAWNWGEYDYRVKKEKKRLWGMVKPLDKSDLIAASRDAVAVGTINWFNSEKELKAHYKTATDNYQVVSVEIEV